MLDTIKSIGQNPWVYIIGLVVYIGGDKLIDLVGKGADAEFSGAVKTEFMELIKDPSTMDTLLANPKFVETLLNHPKTTEFTDGVGKELHDDIVESLVKSDSNKVSMRAYIGKEADIRDEQVLPILAALAKKEKEGKLITKENLKEEVRKVTSRRVTPHSSH
jgi:hypothetical protein